MQQEQLFIESEREAIEALAQRIGGKKVLASEMWPGLEPGIASKKLNNKLNGMDGRHKAKWLSEDSRKAKRIGAMHNCHVYKHWCDDTEGYQRAQPCEPKDSDEEVVARMEAAAAVFAKGADMMNRRLAARELQKANK